MNDYDFDDFMDDLTRAGNWVKVFLIYVSLAVGVVLLSWCSH